MIVIQLIGKQLIDSERECKEGDQKVQGVELRETNVGSEKYQQLGRNHHCILENQYGQLQLHLVLYCPFLDLVVLIKT